MKVYRATVPLTWCTVLLSLVLGGCCRPSEPRLEAGFEEHRATLEEILEMAAEDEHLIRIASDFTWLEDNLAWPRPENEWGLSRERWNHYRKLFAQAEIPAGIRKSGGRTYFVAETCGLSISGWASGYVYSEEPPRPLVKEFGDLAREPEAYIPVAENWYLFYRT